MKWQIKDLMKFTAVAFFGLSAINGVTAQCNSWDKYPGGETEAKKQHVIYRDRFKAKNYTEAYPIWEELFKTVQIPTPAKTTHFLDGVEMCFYFAGKEQDAAKKTAWIEKAIALYDQNAACNGEDATTRAYQGYYMYANQYDITKAYKVFEKALELGKETPPTMIFSYMPAIAVYCYRNKVAGFDAEYMRGLHEKLKKIVDKNIENKKDVQGYQKAWEETQKQFDAIPEIFGCDYWTNKLTPDFKNNMNNAEVLKAIATKLAEKCGKDNAFYKEVWATYRELIKGTEIDRLKKVLESDTSTVYTKIMTCRSLIELDSTLEEQYKEKTWKLYEELAVSPKEWVDDKTKTDDMYRLADHLYRQGSFGAARNYCRLISKIRPNWGKPYILVGIMYASSGPRCSPATNGTGFDAQVCVWPAIDEWIKAKSVDAESAAQANELIGKYSAFLPLKSDMLQRQIPEGSSYTVGCWIGQTTIARGK